MQENCTPWIERIKVALYYSFRQDSVVFRINLIFKILYFSFENYFDNHGFVIASVWRSEKQLV